MSHSLRCGVVGVLVQLRLFVNLISDVILLFLFLFQFLTQLLANVSKFLLVIITSLMLAKLQVNFNDCSKRSNMNSLSSKKE